VGQKQVRRIGLGGLPLLQMIGQAGEQQSVGDGIKALRALGVAFAHLMESAQAVRKKSGRHRRK
jgi:hypothetical protein